MPDEWQVLADQVLELAAFQLDLERGTLKGRCHRFPLVSVVNPVQAVHLLTRRTFDYERCWHRHFRVPFGCETVRVLRFGVSRQLAQRADAFEHRYSRPR
ncbi:hypothetical protein GCM10009827_037580 [Dactylosporangium maewongense]|uniref:Uncharacterized protein n=1 Tax=Dactylosporangium maewongense TaxID=634393 RepID=A0ABN2AGH5_9ACTN